VPDLSIVFTVGNTACALPAGIMREILEDAYVAPAPMAPASIEGVLNRLGRMYVVFDLGALVGIPLERRQKLILFGHEKFSFGSWVDDVIGVASGDQVQADLSLPYQCASVRFGDRIVPVLDHEALFQSVDELI
jgi:chemotaxis signal transduction protein